jgi:phenylacetate-CoA ligase
VILEPVDAQLPPVPPGQVSHTTLLTNLANHLQPLIRFDIGDRIRWAASAAPAAARCRWSGAGPAATTR